MQEEKGERWSKYLKEESKVKEENNLQYLTRYFIICDCDCDCDCDIKSLALNVLLASFAQQIKHNSSLFIFPFTTTLPTSLFSSHDILHISYLPIINMSDPKPDPDSTEASTTSPIHAEEKPKDTTPAAASYTEMASNAAGSATTAAAGVKDSVFSMFGGGAKKEKKEEPDAETEDRSGSSKAKKDAEAADADEPGEVSFLSASRPADLRIPSYRHDDRGS